MVQFCFRFLPVYQLWLTETGKLTCFCFGFGFATPIVRISFAFFAYTMGFILFSGFLVFLFCHRQVKVHFSHLQS